MYVYAQQVIHTKFAYGSHLVHFECYQLLVCSDSKFVCM